MKGGPDAAMWFDDWVYQRPSGCFTFIRGCRPAEVATVLGLSWDQRYSSTDPRAAVEDPADPPPRLATIGDWTCIIERSPVKIRASELLLPLSAGAEALSLMVTPVIDTLRYARDGELVSSVDLIVTHVRHGTEEDLFAPALAAIEASLGPMSAPARAALIMSMIFGLEFTRDMLDNGAVAVPGRPAT
jgi:hypothetical protein